MSMTVTGTVMPNSEFFVLQPTGESGPEGLLKFMFSAPGDQLIFSIVPGGNPRGPGAYAVTVPAGKTMLAIVDASVFKNNVLAVLAESSTAPVPFAVTIE
jgi:hypothetical protein